METKKKSLTKNTIFYMIYNVLNIIFPFLTGVYVARILLPNEIGMVESAKNLVQYFVILSFLGIPTYGLREIAKCRNNQKDLNKTYTELMIINAISTMCFVVVYLLLIFLVPVYRAQIYLYLIVGLLVLLNLFNNTWLYEGLEEFQYISIRNLIFKVISFFVLILFVREENDYLWYASINVIGTAGNYLINILNSKKFVKISCEKINLKKHMKFILYLVFVNLAIEIYSLVDITMLGFLCEKSNVAFYSYGTKIYRILISVLNALTTVVVPKLALTYSENKIKDYNKLITKTFKTIILISIPLIIGILFTSDFLICFIYGDAYISSSYVLKVLSISLLISPIGYLLGSRVMLITGNEKKMMIPVMAGAVINVISNFILIRLLKEIGAAIASVVGEIVVMYVYLHYSKKYFEIENIKTSIKNILYASSIMTIYLFILMCLPIDQKYICLLQIIGAILIYFTVLLIRKESSIIEIKEKIFNRIGAKNGM